MVQGERLKPNKKTPTGDGKQSVVLTSPGSLGGPGAQRNGSGQEAEANKLRLSFFAFQSDQGKKKFPLHTKPPQQALMSFFQAAPLQTGEAGRGRELRTRKAFPGLLIILLLCK